MQLTDLLAKPLIHLSEAKTLGNVYGFWTDKHLKRIRYIEALDEETYAHPAAYSWGKVHVGLDAVCVSTDPETPEGVFVPFKGTIYDTDGRQKGYLQDVVVTHTGSVDHLVTTDGQTLYPRDVVAVGDVLVIRGSRRVGRPRKETRPAPSLEEAFNRADEPTPAGVLLPRAPMPEEVNAQPLGVNVRLVGDYSFLLGRTLSGDLTRHGRLLLAKGTVIDERAVALARGEGQLVALTALSV